MNELHTLVDMIKDALAEFGRQGDLSRSSLETIDMLAHAGKNLMKIIECSKDDSQGKVTFESNESFVRPDGSYNRSMMSKFSRSTSDLSNDLRKMMDKAPDERTRMEFERFIERVESL